MENKTFIIFTTALLLFSSFFSTLTIAENISVLNDGDDYLDQYHEEHDLGFASAGSSRDFEYAQSFKPTYNVLTRIQLNAAGGGWVNGKPRDVVLTIRKDLYGNNLTKPISLTFETKWLEYDFIDLQVTTEETYYILWKDNGGDAFYPGLDGGYYYTRGNGYCYSFSDKKWEGAGVDFCFRTYGRNGTDANNPPETPVITNNVEHGIMNVEYTFEFRSNDVDNDRVQYRVDWGDGSSPSTSELIDCSESAALSHTWSKSGVYWMSIRTIDEHGSESPELRPTGPMYVRKETNSPPLKPKLDGPSEGEFKQVFDFSAITYDCDYEKVYYMFDWGDETTTEWLGPFEPGEICHATKSWTGFILTEYYNVRVTSKDESNAQSPWSDPHEVKVYQGRSKAKIRTGSIEKIFENYPFLNLLRNHLLTN